MSQLHNPVNAQDHLQGALSAPCLIVEYGDYECPSCGQIEPIIHELQQHFGESLAVVFRNFPLSEIHPWAEGAAETAEFAAEHGKFWKMHDLLFENQTQFSNELFLACADKLDLPRQKLSEVLRDKTYRKIIQADFSGGVRSGVNGTPTLFIDGQRYDGSFELASLIEVIRRSSSSSS